MVKTNSVINKIESSNDSLTYFKESFEVMFVREKKNPTSKLGMRESMKGDFIQRKGWGAGFALVLSLCEGG